LFDVCVYLCIVCKLQLNELYYITIN